MVHSESFTNIISVEGYVEITEITDTTISGYLDRDSGSVDNICGTFILMRS